MIRTGNDLPESHGVDNSIHDLLHALGNAEATPDFHNRLLTSLSTHAEAARVPRKPRWGFALPQRLAFAFTVLLIAGTLGLFLIRAPRNSSSSTGTSSNSNLANSNLMTQRHQATARAEAANPLLNNSAPKNSSLAAQQDPSPGRALPSRLYLHLAAASASSPQNTVPLQAVLDAQAFDDLYAPAQPSPQQADTDQEQLVRLMLRQGEKHDLAQLDPAERIAFAQQESREFNAFFNPPAPQLQISLANRVYAPHAVTLDEVRAIDAAEHTPSTPLPTPAGDLK